MDIETLVATIDQTDFSLAEKMNIQTPAIVANQCSKSSKEVFEFNGNRITYLNASDRGVGINRNRLMRNATASICVFADDDMRFLPNYPETVERAFSECQNADMLLFNLVEKNPQRFVNTKVFRIRSHNYAKYGAARIVFRRESLSKCGIHFNTSFGGGAKYGSGEDTIFLRDCLKAGLKLYAVPYAIAEINQEAVSTWFSGYNEKFFMDKGALYSCLHPVLWPFFSVRYTLKYRYKFNGIMSPLNALRLMINGGRSYTNEKEKNEL